MTTITIAIVIVFLLGYACIALETFLHINKAAIALLMFVACWTLFMIDPAIYYPVGDAIAQAEVAIEHHLGSTATTLFFLMGAMTIVEIVDTNGGFDFVRNALRTRNKRRLLWRIAFMTFILSAILDNMTTSIVMIMVLRKLVADKHDRLIYAGLVVIAANAGGAFSPIGDVTTIMLWNSNMITAGGVITEIFIPSLIAMVVPAFILQFSLKGDLKLTKYEDDLNDQDFNSKQRQIIFYLGVGGLVFVPIFRYLTHLPPFVGILLVLAILWTVTELFYTGEKQKKTSRSKRVSKVLSKIDMSTLLFFLGILMAVSCLEEIGILNATGQWLNDISGGNHYVVTGLIGVISSIVDNVPLVAGCMGMYPLAPVGDMAVDGLFWQLLAYCAGVGGSLLIIGSAAGVIVMGLEKISFGWYLKHMTWIAFVGYIAGMLSYLIMNII
ncbi:MAG: sodium:proton antiporter NhaD [Muribaculaceae bacterium]|nr:sodium:proton antiporter NhaD [Muribaculaceae bacterium]